MGNIVLLDELTINKIAAGEVIERPASVIKEIVENSIDAGAKNITIEIKNGGISFIRITDNGKGIAKDDVELAFARHATSKIRSADDLNSVKTMGFRGEALASIAAISNVELVTKTEDEDIGTRIVVEGEKILSIDEISYSKGTTITVRNLFFNTPVRYKFLKKDFTESGYIEDVVTRIALIHPEISIKLINTGKTIIQTNGNGNIKDVIYSIYGKDIANNLLDVNYEYEYIKISGVIGKPEIARSNRTNQIFFVNERYVKDKTLSTAVDQAFKGMIPIGKFPFLILNLDIVPSKIDVNVHPAKLEIRFAEEDIAFKAMYHAVKDTLLTGGFISEREKIFEIKEANKDAFKIPNIEEKIKQTYSISNSNSNKIESGFGLPNKEDFKKEEIKVAPEIPKDASEGEIGKAIGAMQDNIDKTIEKIKQAFAGSALIQEETQSIPQEKEETKRLNFITENYEEESKEEIENKPQIEEEQKLDENNDINSEPEEEIPTDQKDNLEEEFENKEEIVQSTNELEITNENNLEEKTESENEVENIDKDTENPETIINEEPKEDNEEYAENIEENQYQEKEEQTENDIPETNESEEDIQEENKDTEQLGKNKLSFETMYRELFGKEPYGGRLQVEKKKEEDEFYDIDTDMKDSNVSLFEGNEKYKKPTYKFIGIAFNTYIILEINSDIYIMDQHAAHERIMYEKVKKNFFSDVNKDSQLLLLPDIITLTHKEMDIAKENFDLFRKAGFVVEQFDENSVKLSGVPEICIDLDTQELFRETLDEINTVARTAKQEKEEKFIATVACKAAVKANMCLTKEEVDSLMTKLLELPNPFTCPHGRPTAIKMSKYELEKKFSRR